MTIRHTPGRLGRWFLIPLGVILCAAPARAASQPAAKAPSPAARVLDSAVAFRMLASEDLKKAADRFQGTAPLAFVLKTDAWRKAPQIWKTFFGGAFVIAGNVNSPQPVFAFYNPLFDGVLLTQWQLPVDSKTGGVITAAAFAKGSDLRGTTTPAADAAPAAWIDSSRAPPLALAQALKKFIADFEALYPPAGKSVATLATTPAGAAHLAVMAGHAVFNDRLLAMLQEKKHRDVGDVIWSFCSYLAAGDRARLAARIPATNPLPIDKMLELPQEVRTELAPVYTAVTDDSCLVFMSVPRLPQFLGLLRVARDQNGWRIRSFGFYDLANMK